MKRKSSINRMLPELLKVTFSFLLDEDPGYNKILRCVCKRWKSLIPSGKFNPNEFLEYSAQNGYANLCRLAKEWSDLSGTPLDFNCMLYGAAEGGHEDLCYLAKALGANDFGYMLIGADWGGHENLSRLAKAWIEEELCRRAKEWGATDFNGMLAKAASGGHVKVCSLAREWGARGFNNMLEYVE